ncbi:LOW QUALITY PROTEIN: hypothetical protein PHMEG_00013630 [Phytophthora megakarya]|uniref:MULE transposase domain-containing protein n=1 Tax=Phytophthora megakarya TaxID=4795 RepID=A0A225W7C1_9STRA|nr:LOW QUALITY PROTEIN: hypothetical protein PHMEG_00013630 [Phytophthora megakarya]
MLKQRKTSLFVDGTFRCVPAKFKTCIIFLTYDRPTKGYYPAAFILCTSKTYKMYFNAIRLVMEAADDAIEPEFVYCGFEGGLTKAIRNHFPDASPTGVCFSIQPSMPQENEKNTKFPTGSATMKTGVFDMLTVIAQGQVKKQGVGWVKPKIISKCEDIGTHYSNVDKKLSPRLWDIHPFTRSLVSITYNALERFNREINSKIPGPHTNLPDFVGGIE